MIVKPAAGRLVRDPATKRALPAEGAEVSPLDPFWARRLRSGDVEIVSEPESPQPAPAQGAPKE